MSFNEKLQYLRKANKLSQEQLADMLDVTRQAVSKWESGTTYPEMDKLITMCKIFKCSLDDLTNDEIVDIDINKKQTSNNFIGNLVNSIIDIIDKTVKMLRAMSATQIAGLLVALLFLGLFLCLLRIPFEVIEYGFYTIVHNLPNRAIAGALSGIFNMILDVAFFALYILAFVYIYKVAYLDKYEFVEKISVEEKKSEKSNKTVVEVTKEMSGTPVHPKENTLFCFLGGLLLWFLRIMVGFCTMPFIVTLVALFIVGTIAVSLMFEGIVYVGVLLGILFAIVLNVWVIELGCVFVFNKKASFKRLLWTFIIGLCGVGMSIGMIVMEFSSATFIDELPDSFESVTKKEEFAMNPNLVIEGHAYYREIDYVVDDALTDKVVVEATYYDDYTDVVLEKIGNNISYNFYYAREYAFTSKIWKNIKSDLANNTFRDYSDVHRVYLTIRSSEDNIVKIKDNTKKYMDDLRDKTYMEYASDYQYQITFYSDRVSELEDENEELKERVRELEDFKSRIQGVID